MTTPSPAPHADAPRGALIVLAEKGGGWRVIARHVAPRRRSVGVFADFGEVVAFAAWQHRLLRAEAAKPAPA